MPLEYFMPVTMTAAIASRLRICATRRFGADAVRIMVAAVILPIWTKLNWAQTNCIKPFKIFNATIDSSLVVKYTTLYKWDKNHMPLRKLRIDNRDTLDIFQNQFAAKCGVPNGYISMMEKYISPKRLYHEHHLFLFLKRLLTAWAVSK